VRLNASSDRKAGFGRAYRRSAVAIVACMALATVSAPALAEGRTIVAAPYVASAMALGRAVGLPAPWLANLLHFAPRPDEAHVVEADRASTTRVAGLVSVAYERWAAPVGVDSDALTREVAKHLRPRRARR